MTLLAEFTAPLVEGLAPSSLGCAPSRHCARTSRTSTSRHQSPFLLQPQSGPDGAGPSTRDVSKRLAPNYHASPAPSHLRKDWFSLAAAPSGGGTRSVESRVRLSLHTASAIAIHLTNYHPKKNLHPDPRQQVPPPSTQPLERQASSCPGSATSPRRLLVFPTLLASSREYHS